MPSLRQEALKEIQLDWSPATTKVMKNVAAKVKSQQATLPSNGDGLPLAYIDPERITLANANANANAIANVDPTSVPDDAIIPISYTAGYALVDGRPFWERLDGELTNYYELYKGYRDSLYTTGFRSLPRLSDMTGAPASHLEVLSLIYHWQQRNKCYDSYKELERASQKLLHTREMENTHRKTAKDIFDLCVNFLKDNKDHLTPKTALGWFELAVKLERLSLGLPTDKPISFLPDSYADGSIHNLVQINQQINSPETQRISDILEILSTSGALMPRTQPTPDASNRVSQILDINSKQG